MNTGNHHRGFFITTIWTLGLLLLGSIVHATESSLACPDWPTCFGTFMPEMTGGVFWEHLHRLAAAGLVLIFISATYLAWRPELERPPVRRWALAGIGLLVVQSVLGGMTVLMRLPDAISTMHLALAFLFLTLATVLTVVTSRTWTVEHRSWQDVRDLRELAVTATSLTFLQSILGGAVRHTDAGLACPDVPLCLGQWIPPLQSPAVTLHFSHRVTGLLLLVASLMLSVRAMRRLSPSLTRTLALSAGVLIVLQIALGFLSVYTRLSVVTVSLHTLLAASLLSVTAALSALSWGPGKGASTLQTPLGSRKAVATNGS